MTTAATTVRFRAMATDVTVRVAPGPDAPPPDDVAAALRRARDVFTRVESACTRFDPHSPLMRANATPDRWHHVPQECFDAIDEARRAHRETHGLFDPRILETLLRLGYDASLRFDDSPAAGARAGAGAGASVAVLVDSAGRAAEPGQIPVRRAVRPAVTTTWSPELDGERRAVRLGEHPVDLGGIGKGLAVRWAARELAATGAPFLVEAGGDLAVGGDGPRGEGWLVGVEDPAPGSGRRAGTGASPRDAGASGLVAVLRLVDAACATSSVRVRTWEVDGRPVHHLIDPRTGESSASGLRAVTVVGADPAWAEVWSKALFLIGRPGIAQACRDRGLAALWVTDDGRLGASESMAGYVVWEVADES